MPPLRILVVNWLDPANPTAGGAEVHLQETFGRLAAAGHRVALLCSGWPGAPRRVQAGGLDIHRVGTRNTFAALARRYFDANLKDEHFDVIVEDLNKLPLRVHTWSRKPTALIFHHLFGATAFRSAILPIAFVTWLAERQIGRWYRGVPAVAVSPSTASELVRRGLRAEDISVIPNGVDAAWLSPDERERSPQPLLAYVGRLQRYKRVDLAIAALARIRAKGLGATLTIAGRGAEEARLRALATSLGVQHSVSFAGFISEAEKRHLLRRAWIHVLMSEKEGWGLSVLEAGACATPSVAADSPGLRDSVLNERTGLLVPAGDVGALAEALRHLLTDSARRRELGEGARTFAERHSWESAAERFEAYLTRLARGAAPGLVTAAKA